MQIPGWRNLAIILALASQVAGAQVGLQSGTRTGSLLSPDEYRTLYPGHLRLRYPVSHEAEARVIAARVERWVTDLERRIGFHSQELYTIYLTDRDYGNAYFMGAQLGSERHELVPFRLTAVSLGSDIFQFAGMDESAFDVIAHESTHHLQGEMGRPWLESLTGPALNSDGLYVPSWIWEGWAVHRESQGSTAKGRMRQAYFGALLRSGLVGEQRGLQSYDFSSDNPVWMFSSAQYLSGSSFIDFLARHYGEDRVSAFIQSTSVIHMESDYQRSFGKNFDQLLKEFNAELASQAMPTEPKGLQVLWGNQAAEIRGFERWADGSITFVGSFFDDESYWYRLNAKGSVLERRPMRSVLQGVVEPQPSAPVEAASLADQQTLLYLTSAPNRDGSGHVAGVWRYRFSMPWPEKVLDAPDARSFTASSDGQRIWLGEENQGRVAIREVNLGTGHSHELVRLDWAASIAHLRLSPSGRLLAFAAIRPQGTWDVYVLDLANGETRLVHASSGQDFRPRWGADDRRLYFVSDRKGKFELYSVALANPNEICREAEARWIVQDYAVDAAGNVLTIDRQGHRDEILAGPRLAHCEKSAETSRLAASNTVQASFDGPSVSESAWSTLVPTTRMILPSYGRGWGFDFTAILAGESPYKKWSWAAVADFLPKYSNQYTLGFTVGTKRLYPFLVDVGVSSNTDLFGADFNSRHLTSSLRATLPLWNHNLSAQVLRFDPVKGSGPNPRLQGFELRHNFASDISNVLSAGTKRGLELTTSVSYFPNWAGSDYSVALLQANQAVHLPLLLSPTHDFRLGATELFTNDRIEASAGGTARGWSASLQPAMGTNAGLSPLTSRSLQMSGFTDVLFKSHSIQAVKASYLVPLNFLRTGSFNIGDRSWFNLALSDLRMGPYWNAVLVHNNTGTFAGHAYHASAGATMNASLLAFDDEPVLTTTFTLSRRLTDDRAWNFDWNLSARLYY